MEAVVIPAYELDEKLKAITDKLRDLGYIVIIVDDGSGAAIRTAIEYIAKELWDCDAVPVKNRKRPHKKRVPDVIWSACLRYADGTQGFSGQHDTLDAGSRR